MKVTRRSFIGKVGSGVAAATTIAGSLASAHADLVYQHNDWDYAAFDKLIKFKGRGKQVYDCHPINNGDFLGAIKNSFNGLQFGYGVPADQIRIVAAMATVHAPQLFTRPPTEDHAQRIELVVDARWRISGAQRIDERLNITAPHVRQP